MAIAKEQIRQIISQNDIINMADMFSLLKESFKDILQELMEAELEAELRYSKNWKDDLDTDNKSNRHSDKTFKSQYGEFHVLVPRNRKGKFDPKLIPKYQSDVSGIEDKIISLYGRGMRPEIFMISYRIFTELSYLQRWSARSLTVSFQRLKSGSPVRLIRSIPLYSWTASTIRFVRMEES